MFFLIVERSFTTERKCADYGNEVASDSKANFPNTMFCFSIEETLDRSPLNNAWKIYNFKKEKWYIFFTKKAAHKERWMKAFKDERRRVKEDAKTGNIVSREGDSRDCDVTCSVLDKYIQTFCRRKD